MAGGIFTDRLTIQGRFPHLDRTGDSCPEEGDISVFLQHPADLLVQACPPVVHSNKDTCYLQRMSGVFLDQGNVAGELCQPHDAEHLCLRGDDQLVRTEHGVYLCRSSVGHTVDEDVLIRFPELFCELPKLCLPEIRIGKVPFQGEQLAVGRDEVHALVTEQEAFRLRQFFSSDDAV